MKVLTETDLRKAKVQAGEGEYSVAEDVFVTPAALEYLKDRGITLKRVPAVPAGSSMTRTPVEKRGNRTYIDAATGAGYAEKPEEMTHLRGNLLVPKTHPRIALRGRIDYLEAKVLLLESRCPAGCPLRADLESALSFLRAILGAEVKEEPLAEVLLFGLNHADLRKISHDIQGNFGFPHPIPSASMPRMALELNLLRTEVREAELIAAEAFPEGDTLGIIRHFNRLSSGIYILFCRLLAGYYGKTEE